MILSPSDLQKCSQYQWHSTIIALLNPTVLQAYLVVVWCRATQASLRLTLPIACPSQPQWTKAWTHFRVRIGSPSLKRKIPAVALG